MSSLDLLRIPSVADVGTRADFNTVLSNDAAANAEWLYTVPAGHYMKLVAVSVSCVQGNTQTPRPYLVIDDGTNVILKAPGASAVQSADITSQYTWAEDLPLSAAAALTVNTAPLPAADNLILGPGFRISSETVGKGANTNYGKATLFVVDFT